MSANSKIEWTDHTFNVAWGCVKASPGCDNCYADRDARRYGFQIWGPGADRRTFGEKYWAQPLKWNAEAIKAGVRRRVFCSSMTDLFLNDATIDAEREKLWPLIERTPNLDWQLLTKHPERFKSQLPATLPANAWLGVSIETADYAWRADMLREASAAVRFLSLEPLLGHIPAIIMRDMDWVICGGESGPGARPMHPAWAESIRDDCQAMGIPFLFKQWGSWAYGSRADGTHLLKTDGTLVDRKTCTQRTDLGYGGFRDEDLIDRGHRGWVRVRKMDKVLAGRDLDGRTWDEYPT